MAQSAKACCASVKTQVCIPRTHGRQGTEKQTYNSILLQQGAKWNRDSPEVHRPGFLVNAVQTKERPSLRQKCRLRLLLAFWCLHMWPARTIQSYSNREAECEGMLRFRSVLGITSCQSRFWETLLNIQILIHYSGLRLYSLCLSFCGF